MPQDMGGGGGGGGGRWGGGGGGGGGQEMTCGLSERVSAFGVNRTNSTPPPHILRLRHLGGGGGGGFWF